MRSFREARTLIVPAVAATLGAAALLVVPAALGEGGDVVCNGTAPKAVAHDLVVPEGATCVITPRSQIGHDVRVERGATLINHGGRIGHDVHADDPAGIGLGSNGKSLLGRIGHDVHISGVTGSALAGNNFICSTRIGHDVHIEHGAASAGPFVIGAQSFCTHGVK